MSLDCPTGANMAAIAKQLHETAVQAEQRIYALEQQLRAAANRPTLVQVTDALQTGMVTGAENIIGTTSGFSFVTTFNNTAVESGESISNNDEPFNILGEGLYEIGMFANVVPSGAVTAGSFRHIRVQQYTPDPLSTGPLVAGFRRVQDASYTTFEPNVGIGMDTCVGGQFRIRPGDRIFFTLEHNNAASTLNVSIGSIGWMCKVSDATITEVL